MDFEAIIGLEMHIQMKTKSKMFSSSPVSYGEDANTCVAPYDMAFPGSMPSVNKRAVINAIRVCHALNMTIDNELWFDRKNYFYSDLPKGYQITQDKRPIGKEGYLEIITSKGNKRIGIERLHIEEDTCKQIHYKDHTTLDFNRAGIPLVEIVSKPEIRSAEEAVKYVEKIRSIVTFLDVSKGKMEEGSIRCDVNISIKDKNSSKFGTKVEIKNLNTLLNIEQSINYEINRQIERIKNGKKIIQETRRFDEKKKETVLMRLKTDAIDYKNFIDPNIIPIKLSKEFIEEAIKTSPELKESKIMRYKGMGLKEYDCSLLTNDKETSEYFDKLIKYTSSYKVAANWMNVEVQSVLNKEGIDITKFPISPKHLAQLIELIKEGKISNKQAKEVFIKMLKEDNSPNDIITSDKIIFINNDKDILKVIQEVLKLYPQSIIDYKNGKDRAVSFIVGQVMKITQGKVNPGLTNKLVVEELKRR